MINIVVKEIIRHVAVKYGLNYLSKIVKVRLTLLSK